MSEFDFLKEFGKNLKREGQHEESIGADWDDLQKRLDANELQQKHRRRIVGWLFPLFVSAGFLSLGIAIWQSKADTSQARNEIADLKAEIEEYESDKDKLHQKPLVVGGDTSFQMGKSQLDLHENLDHKTDVQRHFTNAQAKKEGEHLNQFLAKKLSVNQIQNMSNTERNSSESVFPKDENQGILIEKPILNQEKLLVLPNLRESSVDSKTLADPDILSNNWVVPLESLPLVGPKLLSVQKKEYLLDDSLFFTPTIVSPMLRFHSSDYIVGVRHSFIFPINHRTVKNSFSYGLTVEKELTSRLRLTLGADYGQLYVMVKTKDLGSHHLPNPAPPSSHHMLENVRVMQPVIDLSIGLRYVFLSKMRSHPFVTMAWVGEQTRNQLLRYEYRNHMTNASGHNRIRNKDGNFNPNGLQIGLGTNLYFSRRWSFGAEGLYQRHFGTGSQLLGQRIGIRTGLKYHF
jgi:hypothetical protein